MAISLNFPDTHIYINKLESLFNIPVIFTVVGEFGLGYSTVVYSLYDLGKRSLDLFQDLFFMLNTEVFGLSDLFQQNSIIPTYNNEYTQNWLQSCIYMHIILSINSQV